MKISISSENENPLMNRKVIKGEILFDAATPRRYDIKLALAKETKTSNDLLILRRVRNVFGEKKLLFEAQIYKSQKDLDKVSRVLVKKNAKPELKEKPAEEAKPEEKPAEEAKPEEKPAEEAKPEEKPAEEAKPEEKPAEEAKPEEKPVETKDKEEKV
jgi:ribosomal protein S24E